MNILGVGQARVSGVSLIRRFPVEDLRRKAFEFEDALQGLVAAKVAFGPDETSPAPDAPRFTIADGKRIFVASSITTQLELNFSGGIPAGGLVSALKNSTQTLDAIYAKILSHQKIYYSGLVILSQFPSNGLDLAQLAQQVAKGVISETIPDPAISLDLTYGIRSGPFNRTYTLSEYSLFSRKVVQPILNLRPPFIDSDFEKPDEIGLQFKIDINSRPRIDSPSRGDLEDLREDFAKALKDDVPRFLGDLLVGMS